MGQTSSSGFTACWSPGNAGSLPVHGRGSVSASPSFATPVVISPEFIGTNILFQTVSFDRVFWALACLLFVRLLRGADPREWLWLGLVFVWRCS